MERDLEYYKEGLRKIHNIYDDNDIELVYKLVEEIKDKGLSRIELIELFRPIDAEIISDVLNALVTENVITEEDYEAINDALKCIYEPHLRSCPYLL